MKNLTILFIALLLIQLTGCKNESEQDVIMENNSSQDDKSEGKTSKKIKLPLKTVKKSKWVTGYLVDDFGDRLSTSPDFVKSWKEGTYSNSAISNASLTIKLLFTKENTGIFLYERSRNNAAEKFIGVGTIKLKNSNGDKLEVLSFEKWNQAGGLSVSTTDNKKLRSFLLNSTGEVKFVIYDKYSSIYRFAIDVYGFRKALNEIQ